MSQSIPQQPSAQAPSAARPEVILASASATRARLLRAAGIVCRCQAAALDEDEVKADLRGRGAAPAEVAMELARLKAERVSETWPRAVVVAADQVLVCEGTSFDKPADRAAAQAQLALLSGRAHELVTATCLARQGAVLWRHDAAARLVMRELSEGFIEDYLARLGAAAQASVGGYQIEGLGAQLFRRIEGDFFAILGLSLLPLLEALRAHRVIAQ